MPATTTSKKLRTKKINTRKSLCPQYSEALQEEEVSLDRMLPRRSKRRSSNSLCDESANKTIKYAQKGNQISSTIEPSLKSISKGRKISPSANSKLSYSHDVIPSKVNVTSPTFASSTETTAQSIDKYIPAVESKSHFQPVVKIKPISEISGKRKIQNNTKDSNAKLPKRKHGTDLSLTVPVNSVNNSAENTPLLISEASKKKLKRCKRKRKNSIICVLPSRMQTRTTDKSSNFAFQNISLNKVPPIKSKTLKIESCETKDVTDSKLPKMVCDVVAISANSKNSSAKNIFRLKKDAKNRKIENLKNTITSILPSEMQTTTANSLHSDVQNISIKKVSPIKGPCPSVHNVTELPIKKKDRAQSVLSLSDFLFKEMTTETIHEVDKKRKRNSNYESSHKSKSVSKKRKISPENSKLNFSHDVKSEEMFNVSDKPKEPMKSKPNKKVANKGNKISLKLDLSAEVTELSTNKKITDSMEPGSCSHPIVKTVSVTGNSRNRELGIAAKKSKSHKKRSTNSYLTVSDNSINDSSRNTLLSITDADKKKLLKYKKSKKDKNPKTNTTPIHSKFDIQHNLKKVSPVKGETLKLEHCLPVCNAANLPVKKNRSHAVHLVSGSLCDESTSKTVQKALEKRKYSLTSSQKIRLESKCESHKFINSVSEGQNIVKKKDTSLHKNIHTHKFRQASECTPKHSVLHDLPTTINAQNNVRSYSERDFHDYGVLGNFEISKSSTPIEKNRYTELERTQKVHLEPKCDSNQFICTISEGKNRRVKKKLTSNKNKLSTNNVRRVYEHSSKHSVLPELPNAAIHRQNDTFFSESDSFDSGLLHNFPISKQKRKKSQSVHLISNYLCDESSSKTVKKDEEKGNKSSSTFKQKIQLDPKCESNKFMDTVSEGKNTSVKRKNASSCKNEIPTNKIQQTPECIPKHYELTNSITGQNNVRSYPECDFLDSVDLRNFTTSKSSPIGKSEYLEPEHSQKVDLKPIYDPNQFTSTVSEGKNTRVKKTLTSSSINKLSTNNIRQVSERSPTYSVLPELPYALNRQNNDASYSECDSLDSGVQHMFPNSKKKKKRSQSVCLISNSLCDESETKTVKKDHEKEKLNSSTFSQKIYLEPKCKSDKIIETVSEEQTAKIEKKNASSQINKMPKNKVRQASEYTPRNSEFPDLINGQNNVESYSESKFHDSGVLLNFTTSLSSTSIKKVGYQEKEHIQKKHLKPKYESNKFIDTASERQNIVKKMDTSHKNKIPANKVRQISEHSVLPALPNAVDGQYNDGSYSASDFLYSGILLNFPTSKSSTATNKKGCPELEHTEKINLQLNHDSSKIINTVFERQKKLPSFLHSNNLSTNNIQQVSEHSPKHYVLPELPNEINGQDNGGYYSESDSGVLRKFPTFKISTAIEKNECPEVEYTQKTHFEHKCNPNRFIDTVSEGQKIRGQIKHTSLQKNKLSTNDVRQVSEPSTKHSALPNSINVQDNDESSSESDCLDSDEFLTSENSADIEQNRYPEKRYLYHPRQITNIQYLNPVNNPSNFVLQLPQYLNPSVIPIGNQLSVHPQDNYQLQKLCGNVYPVNSFIRPQALIPYPNCRTMALSEPYNFQYNTSANVFPIGGFVPNVALDFPNITNLSNAVLGNDPESIFNLKNTIFTPYYPKYMTKIKCQKICEFQSFNECMENVIQCSREKCICDIRNFNFRYFSENPTLLQVTVKQFYSKPLVLNTLRQKYRSISIFGNPSKNGYVFKDNFYESSILDIMRDYVAFHLKVLCEKSASKGYVVKSASKVYFVKLAFEKLPYRDCAYLCEAFPKEDSTFNQKDLICYLCYTALLTIFDECRKRKLLK